MPWAKDGPAAVGYLRVVLPIPTTTHPPTNQPPYRPSGGCNSKYVHLGLQSSLAPLLGSCQEVPGAFFFSWVAEVLQAVGVLMRTALCVCVFIHIAMRVGAAWGARGVRSPRTRGAEN